MTKSAQQNRNGLKYEDGDVNLYDVKITNSQKTSTVDLRGQLLTLSIFEDMEQPTIYAELYLRDEIDFINKLPIIGEEDIEISFKTLGREEITRYKLKVYNVVTSDISLNMQGASYKLECVSEEHFLGTILNIEQSYKDTISNMVNDLLVNKIKTKKQIDIEQTKGIVNITMPRIKAFQAIDMLRQRSIGMAPSGGVFVFFQNQTGIHFKSIEKLIEFGKQNLESRVFTYSPTINTDEYRATLSFRNLINYEHLKKTNNVEKIHSGVFNNSTKSYDLLSKTFDDTEFKLSEQANKMVSGQNRKTNIPNTPAFVSTYSNVKDNRFFIARDSSKPNDYLNNFISYKQAFITLFNQNVTRALVNGDSALKVGDVVELQLPEATAINPNNREDPTTAGNYLITKLRHLIFLEQGKFKHRISFDCNRTGTIA